MSLWLFTIPCIEIHGRTPGLKGENWEILCSFSTDMGTVFKMEVLSEFKSNSQVIANIYWQTWCELPIWCELSWLR